MLNGKPCPVWPMGLLTLVGAVLVIRWGLRLWRDPDSLKQDAWAYKRYVAWLRAYQYDTWKERARSAKAHWRYDHWVRFRESRDWKRSYRPVKLTRQDVQSLAMFNLLGGFLVFVAGIFYLVSGWLAN